MNSWKFHSMCHVHALPDPVLQGLSLHTTESSLDPMTHWRTHAGRRPTIPWGVKRRRQSFRARAHAKRVKPGLQKNTPDVRCPTMRRHQQLRGPQARNQPDTMRDTTNLTIKIVVTARPAPNRIHLETGSSSHACSWRNHPCSSMPGPKLSIRRCPRWCSG